MPRIIKPVMNKRDGGWGWDRHGWGDHGWGWGWGSRRWHHRRSCGWWDWCK